MIVCVALGGAIFTLFLLSRRRTYQEQPQSTSPKQLETAKSEIESLEFEKSILSHSITSAYEFAQGNGRSQERDHLVTKYKSQLDNINKRIDELQLSVEFTELSEARNKLVSLIEAKITSLDGRLSEMSQKYGLSMDHSAEDRQSDSIAQYQEKKTFPKPIEAKDPMAEFIENKSEDTNVKDVQREILQALNRLENVDIDYELLSQSSQLEPKTSTEGDRVTSYPLKTIQDNKNDNNITMDISRVSRDAVSSIVRSNPS